MFSSALRRIFQHFWSFLFLKKSLNLSLQPGAASLLCPTGWSQPCLRALCCFGVCVRMQEYGKTVNWFNVFWGFAFFIVTQSSHCPVVSVLLTDVLLHLAILFIVSVLDFTVCQNNIDIWRAVILQIRHTLLWNSSLYHKFLLVRV